MSVSYWQDTYKGSARYQTDVLIIGAGLAGFSTAYWLKKEDPKLHVSIVDKGLIGSGASGRNAGFITCGSTEHFSRMTSAYGEDKATEIWKFTEYNHKLIYDEFGYKTLRRCDYVNQGSWTLAATEYEAQVIQETVKKLKEKGVMVGWYNNYYIQEMFRPHDAYPALVEGFYGGAHYFEDAEIHPLKYLKLLQALSQVPVYENTEVFHIDTKSDKIEVYTNRKRFLTESVILCTNAWSKQLFPWFENKVTPARGQILVTEPTVQFLQPCYCSFVLDYFRQLADGRVLIGGFRNADVEKEVGFSDEVNPLVQTKLEEFLKDHFPSLRYKKIEYRWSGVMGFSADGYPIVGSLDEDPRIFYNVGFTAHGLGFTFATGKLTADLILKGKDPGIFSGRRFSK